MRNTYTFKLEHTVGIPTRLPFGLLYMHGMMFADNGFGEFISVDAPTAFYFAVGA